MYDLYGVRVMDRDERTNRPLLPGDRSARLTILVGKSRRLADIDLSRSDLLRLAEEAIYALRLLEGPE